MSTSANSPKALELIAWLRDYASTRINSQLIDERRCITPNIVLDFGNKGLMGLQAPIKYGGLNLSHIDCVHIYQQLGAIDCTLAPFVGIHNYLGLRPILLFADSKRKEELLPDLATGRKLAGFAITEPEAGSNPYNIQATSSVNPQGGWLLNGTKYWVGMGAWANVINIFTKQLDLENNIIGVSGFSVNQDSAGLCQGKEALTMGVRGLIQNTIYLNDVAVDQQHLLGELGQGMWVANKIMMHARLMLGAVTLGGLKRCLQLALRYTKKRTISTGTLLNNAYTIDRLSDLTYASICLEHVMKKSCTCLDNNIDVPEQIMAVIKIIGAEYFWKAADRLIQLCGGRGYIESNIAPQLLRDARVYRIFEGPTEALLHYIGASLYHSPDALDDFFINIFSASEVSKKLRLSIETLKDLTKSSKIPREYSTILIGRIACYLTLMAATKAEIMEQPNNEILLNAYNWAYSRYTEIFSSVADSMIAKGSFIDATQLEEVIIGYQASIGDVEQRLPAPNYFLDSRLKKNQC